MNLRGIHHVSINVTNLERALEFYVDILGLDELERPELGFPGLWLKAGAQEVHLLAIDSERPLKEQHFAFDVTDVEAVQQALVAADVMVSAPSEIAGICRQAFTRDPSGNLIEFNQRL